jgi:chromosome segregation ATPase
MGQDPGEVGAQRVEDAQDKTPEQLRAEIEDTREDLGETVEALAAKTDVKSRARARADEVKTTALRKKDELLAKAKQSTPATGNSAATNANADSRPAGATAAPNAAVEQVKGLAQDNPVPTAALAAFIGGVAVGRMIGRR